MNSEHDRLARWRERLREEVEAAVPELRVVGRPDPGDADPAAPVAHALELARRHATTARHAGADVVVRAVGVDAHGYAWATFHLGDRAATLCTSDDAATLRGLAELAGA